ncbi:hypothetical protein V3C99_013628 [Haemonchus contortus]
MDCSGIELLIKNVWFLSAVCLQAVASYISAVICIIVATKCKSLHFHINCRILITTLLILYIVHSVVIAALQTAQMIQYLTTTEPCDVGLPPDICFYLRVPASCCMVCFSALQFAMVLERAIALWKREQYESYGPQLGIISVIVSIGASIGVMAWAVQKENFVTHSFYCSTVTAQTADRISLMSYGLCVLDLITLLGIIFLNIFNNFTMKWFKKLFNLQSYQLRENAHVIRVMLPLTIFQTVCYLLFSILSVVIVSSRDDLPLITYQTLIVLIYLIPYYTAVSPIIIWYIIRWSRKMREIKLENLRQQSKTADNELYFRELSKMWNAVPVER